MPTFVNPPTGDAALTARTFRQNPTLTAALDRLKTRGAHGINTGAEVPGGSDANDPLPIEPIAHCLTYAYRYQIHTVTASGVPSDILIVAADDMCDAIQRAIAQLVETHADGIRVVSCREVNPKRGAA